MIITADMVKTLRERTGAAMMACKKALQETQGDIEAAAEVLRKAGEMKAAQRADKMTAEGKNQYREAVEHLSPRTRSEADFPCEMSEEFLSRGRRSLLPRE